MATGSRISLEANPFLRGHIGCGYRVASSRILTVSSQCVHTR